MSEFDFKINCEWFLYLWLTFYTLFIFKRRNFLFLEFVFYWFVLLKLIQIPFSKKKNNITLKPSLRHHSNISIFTSNRYSSLLKLKDFSSFKPLWRVFAKVEKIGPKRRLNKKVSHSIKKYNKLFDSNIIIRPVSSKKEC